MSLEKQTVIQIVTKLPEKPCFLTNVQYGLNFISLNPVRTINFYIYKINFNIVHNK